MIGDGGWKPGGGVSLEVRPRAKDHPSIVPGAGVRLPAPILA